MHRVLLSALMDVSASRPDGYVEEIVSAGTISSCADGDVVELDDATYRSLLGKYSPGTQPRRCGPGCQLTRTFGVFGLRDDGTCGCSEMAAKMDAWGDACWDHLEEIVDHLRAAAEKRGIPFLATAARIAVGRAIEAAARERATPGTAAGEPA